MYFFWDRSTGGTGDFIIFLGGQEHSRTGDFIIFLGDRRTGETGDLVCLDKPMGVRRTSILRSVRCSEAEACGVYDVKAKGVRQDAE